MTVEEKWCGNCKHNKRDWTNRDNKDDVVNIDYFSIKHGWWGSGEKVYAWMPLPEPYKGGEDE